MEVTLAKASAASGLGLIDGATCAVVEPRAWVRGFDMSVCLKDLTPKMGSFKAQEREGEQHKLCPEFAVRLPCSRTILALFVVDTVSPGMQPTLWIISMKIVGRSPAVTPARSCVMHPP